MDQFAGVFALIAPDRFGRLQGTQLTQTTSSQDTADSGGRDADLYGNLLSRPALGAVALCVGIRCGAISSDMKISSQAARSIV
jgi:hypothetical protein